MSPKIFSILLVILPVALYYGYINPAYSGEVGLVWTPEASIILLRSQKVQYENAIAQVDLVENEMTKINKDYLNLDPVIKNKVEMMLLDSIDQFKLRNEVTSIANKKGVAISGLKVTEGIRNKNQKIGGYKVAFTVKGNYSTIKKLIEEYEKSTRFFVVDSIAIGRYVKKDDSGIVIDDGETLDATITFEVYYLRSSL